jgi:hypothetical protein
VVDVGWSQKEESDDDLSRLNLEKSRELKQLKDEFADLIREAQDEDAPAPPATEPAPSDLPVPEPTPPDPSAPTGGTP